MRARIVISLILLLAVVSTMTSAQAVPTASAAVPQVVPQLVNFSGALSDLNGKPLSGVVGVTFLLYKDETGGSPLWLETQNVQLDKTGHYKVMLGSTNGSGLPSDIFVAGEARWLGVQAQGQPEQARIMLLSVPYALKAGDAATVGGLPPSAFVLAAPATTGATASAKAGAFSSTPPPAGAVTGSGTVNFVPLWDSTSDIISSVIFQTGTGSTAKIGVNTTTPTSTLDVKGGSTIRGTLSLPANGTATATIGKNSQALNLAASSFSSGTSTAVNQTFQWKAEPAGNNTASPSGTMNLLFGQGTSIPAETGLKIANSGQITFAAGQTFPGAGTGTITGVTAGTDLTGGGSAGNVTLNLDATKVPQLSGGNSFTGNQTVNGNVSAAQLVSTIAQGTAPLSVTSSTQVPNLNASFLDGLSASAFQTAGTYASLGANTFGATQTIGNGDLSVTNGDLDLPQTTGVAVGVINVGGNPFIHTCCNVSDIFVGVAAGNFTMSGNGNTGVGYDTMVKNTTGYSNAAFGLNALQSNTTGDLNTATGGGALQSNTTGSLNVASGLGALQSNTTGSSNVGVGYTAGNTTNNQNTTGSNNTFVGFFSNPGTQTTLNNVTAIGASAQATASNATAIGANAQATASNSLVLGSIAGVNGATASTNVGIGTTAPASTLDVHGTGNFTGLVTFAAGQTFPGTGTITGVTAGTGLTGGGTSGAVSLSLASNACAAGSAVSALPFTCSPFATLGANTLTGNQSVTGNVSATGTVNGGVVNATSGFSLAGTLFATASNQNTFLGFSAGNPSDTGCCNTGTGVGALSSNTSGTTNTAIGETALGFNTTGNYNTATGYQALYSNVGGNGNTANGWIALASNTTGYENTAIGYEALWFNTGGNQNTAVGTASMLKNTTGIENTALGLNSLSQNTTGYQNTATGATALANSTTGSDNVANGWESMGATTTGSGNTAIGPYSLELNSTGSYNTAMGFNAGTTANATASTGSNNTFVGFYANPGTQTNLNNAAAIGSNAQVTVSNAMVLGSINGVNGATASTNVGIGTTAPAYLLHIGNSGGASTNNFLRIEGPTASGTGGLAASFGGYGAFAIDAVGNAGGRFVVTEIGRVGIGAASPLVTHSLTIGQSTGHAIADGWDTYSSRRWKTNIQTLNGALAKVERLRGVSYDLKESGKHEVGVIAEEVGAVVPEIVSWEENGSDARGVDYSRLTALLIEATKEQERLLRQQQEQIKAQQVEIQTEHRQIVAQAAQIRSQEAAAKVQQAQIAKLGAKVKTIQTALSGNDRTDSGVLTANANISRTVR